MAKQKKPLLDKNLDKFINQNFDKKDRNKQESLKFEWFANSMHIWHCSSQTYNSNTKIGKEVSLGHSQGGDAFFISINNYDRIFTVKDSIEEIINYIKDNAKIITFHFIQTKKTDNINWPQFLNLIEIPNIIWNGNDFPESQPILKKVQELIDSIVEDDDPILGKLQHKLEIVFYTNKDNENLLKLESDWKTNINNKRSELSNYFNQKDIEIIFRGSEFLNDIYEKINSNEYSLLVKKEEVIEADEKKYLIGYITAKELLDAIAPTINGNRSLFPDVFKNNIRLYLGPNEINKKIEETLINEPKKFHLYNNGLTITTKEIKDNTRNFIINSVNIVNGCQTANSIYNVFKNNNINDSEVKIPVRIIVAQDKEYENITIRTNTQNGLDAKDLISINNIQIELQEKFENSTFLSKTFYYKRQKSGELNDNIDKDFIIQIDDILRSTFSTIMLIPNKVSGYFDQTTLKYIDKIFDERFLELYFIITASFKLIEDEIEENYLDFNRLKYHILYLFYKFLNKDVDLKEFEQYFRISNDEYDDEYIKSQDVLIKSVYSNFYSIINNENNFKKIISYLIDKTREKFPELLDLSTKEKERILYKAVERLPRIRTMPIFDEFNTIYSDNLTTIINATN